ncbi:unnamed protein product [Lepeophtheirus salmonis]|uniref:(salmon louse) hypothetical protein n=1 Tax=Lepeophtheirus salmonis TaxID=72036 RepID=A0A7R8CVM4_LEPSM|nr:unnamed protein product [Lepeophtheirus salmonis]CAF2946155.1 unnamed protein product [Lepeophtheirus salmonis]
MGTVEFLEFVQTMLNILNLKIPSVGLKINDNIRNPITKENCSSFPFLKEFADLLTVWEDNSERELTKKTCLATKHTCLAASDLAEYLLDSENNDFDYILLAMFNPWK